MVLSILEEEIKKITEMIEWNFEKPWWNFLKPKEPKEVVWMIDSSWQDEHDTSILIYTGRYYGMDFKPVGDLSKLDSCEITLRQKVSPDVIAKLQGSPALLYTQNNNPLVPGETIHIELKRGNIYAIARLDQKEKKYRIESGTVLRD